MKTPLASTSSEADRANWWQRHRLGAFVIKRLLAALGTTLAVSILVFAAIIVLPGDVVESVLGRNASAKQTAAVRAELTGGLPPWRQYLSFLDGITHGDLGLSTAALVSGQRVPVSELIGPALWHSMVLALVAMVFFIPIMVILGLTAGLKPGSRRDNVISTGSLAAGALPEYFVAAVLIAVFFTQLNWLPPVSSVRSGTSIFAAPDHLILPVATLLIVSLAFGSRQLRSSVANILNQDYVTFAQLNGYSRRQIIRRYILPNSLGPTVQIVAQQLAYVLTGIVIVETVFNYPGIGNMLVRSINAQDVQLTLVIATILAALGIFINLLADIVAILIDPVVRTSL